jgi:hypothetical protein
MIKFENGGNFLGDLNASPQMAGRPTYDMVGMDVERNSSYLIIFQLGIRCSIIRGIVTRR